MQNAAAFGFLIALGATLVGASTSTAHAYLDPGTGSIILQILLGGVAGLVLACRLYWQKFVAMFGFKRKPDELQEIRQDQG